MGSMSIVYAFVPDPDLKKHHYTLHGHNLRFGSTEDYSLSPIPYPPSPIPYFLTSNYARAKYSNIEILSVRRE